MIDKKLHFIIKELITQELKEMSTTAGVSGYLTPRAFKKNKIKESKFLKEASYRRFKNKISQNSSNIKTKKALREIQKCLNELESIVDFNKKLKEEIGENKITNNNKQLVSIYKKLIEINKKIKTLR